MSKAILVMDMPDSCADCRFCREIIEGLEAFCLLADDPNDNELYKMIDTDYCQCKPIWCLFKELPNKENGEMKIRSDEYSDGFTDGFNACLDEICKPE